MVEEQQLTLHGKQVCLSDTYRFLYRFLAHGKSNS